MCYVDMVESKTCQGDGCTTVLFGRQTKYCSNQCKLKNAGKHHPSNTNVKNDPNKRIRHTLTGKVYKDHSNVSGVLTRYSEEVLGEPFNPEGWEIFTVEPMEKLKCPMCNWSTVDVENKSGWFTTHLKQVHGLTPEDFCVHHPEYKKLWVQYWLELERKEHLNESEENRIQCLVCGEYYKKITNLHLRDKHGMTTKEYRDRFGIYNLSSVGTRKKLSTKYYDNHKLLDVRYVSNGEIEICKYLDSLGIEYISPSRKGGIEIDIYIPDKKVGIEFNGLYWNSEHHGKKDRNYHISKTVYLESCGDQLIHIFEDEWRDKQNIVKARLKSILGISDVTVFARKCEIRELSSTDTRKFLTEYHIQGNDVSNIRLGCFYMDELVSVMTFGKLRKALGNRDAKDSYELMRFCSKGGYNVIGAASKLLKYFERMYKPEYILSYADRRYSSRITDTLYDKLGFGYSGETKPNYWYMYRHMVREYRYKYAKYKLLTMFDVSDSSKTEWEIMTENNFDRIWDCGSLKYEKQYS